MRGRGGGGSGWSVIYSKSRLAIVIPRACSSGFGSGREGWLASSCDAFAARLEEQGETETEATHDLRITRVPANGNMKCNLSAASGCRAVRHRLNEC
jgi:hypothetical protein